MLEANNVVDTNVAVPLSVAPSELPRWPVAADPWTCSRHPRRAPVPLGQGPDLSVGAVVVHPERRREQREASLTRLSRCEVHSMLGIEPHDGVAVLVLHGSDINRGAVVAVYGRPARAIVTLGPGISFVVPDLAPGGAVTQLETVGGSHGSRGPAFAAARRRMGKTARIIGPGSAWPEPGVPIDSTGAGHQLSPSCVDLAAALSLTRMLALSDPATPTDSPPESAP